MENPSTYIKSLQRKIIAKLAILFIILAAFVVTGNSNTVRPVKVNKKAEEKSVTKTVEPSKDIKQKEYLKNILPGVLAIDPADKRVTYKKDANGNYTMVQDEGC